jgi:phosphoribosyl 1,2-cyclic phosphate phosphodiesterase
VHIHILGSAAGKPVPRPFCACRVCEHARHVGGKDLRTRTTVCLYPGDTWSMQGPIKKPRYQVDLSPDLTYQLDRQRVDLSDLEHLLFTHAHADHCCGQYLAFRRTVRGPVSALPLLHVYGDSGVQQRLLADIQDLEANRCEFHLVDGGDTLDVGELRVTAFASTHGGALGCLHFGIDDGQHKVLMAWDGWWEEQVWDRLRDWSFDALIMECTYLGPHETKMASHLRAADFLEIRRRLIAQGTLDSDALTVALHIGDNGGLTHEEAQDLLSEHDIIVGYDGLVVEVW